MIGIEKGDIMKINEVNTMTPRQNDLVVKNISITTNMKQSVSYDYVWISKRPLCNQMSIDEEEQIHQY